MPERRIQREATVPLVARSHPRPPRHRCCTPGCHEPTGPGSRFCPEHAAVLHRVRDELEASAGWRGGAKRSWKRALACRAQGCVRERLHGHAFCDECERAGWIEEDTAA